MTVRHTHTIIIVIIITHSNAYRGFIVSDFFENVDLPIIIVPTSKFGQVVSQLPIKMFALRIIIL